MVIHEVINGLRLSYVTQVLNTIFLVETWEHEAKRISNIDGYTIKSIWPHTRSNIRWAEVACIYSEG